VRDGRKQDSGPNADQRDGDPARRVVRVAFRGRDRSKKGREEDPRRLNDLDDGGGQDRPRQLALLRLGRVGWRGRSGWPLGRQCRSG
jgi:hypothetical protein